MPDIMTVGGAQAMGRGLLLVAVILLAAVAICPAVALAAPPTLTIENPAQTQEKTPAFSGTTDDLVDQVTVKVYAGSSASGSPVQTPSAIPVLGAWKTGPVSPLRNGQYTAVAEQTNNLDETGESNPVTFTVNAPLPPVTLTSPINGSSTSGASEEVSGSAGVEGDLPEVTVQLFAGGAVGAQNPLETIVVRASNGAWSGVFGGLSPGTYTARAEQTDDAGNIGISGPVTFTVTEPPSPPTPAPPVASFTWFPSAPKVGESVSLVSSSTDAASPITAFAWSLAASGAFQAGKPVLTTSFATAGAHTVRLSVTDAAGRSSVATETIYVTSPPLVLMAPFPIVRIAGSVTSSGANIGLLTVQAPVAARVTVTCRGRGCPRKSQSRIARSSHRSKASTVQLSFPRFERFLLAGVVLEIRVSKPGEIGKYTRFVIRRHMLPVRVDSCVGPTDPKPIACPS